MSEANAAVLASNCVAAERDGAESHGLFRVGHYISALRSNEVDGHALPVLDSDSSASVVSVDARNGFAQPALELARRPAIDKARSTGVSIIAIRNSRHLSTLWLDVEPFANEGLIAFAFVNSIPRVVPWDGGEPVLGTNPMALAVPRQDDLPLVFDQASSVMALGDVAIAAKAGQPLPSGAGVDRDGRPTTVPQSVLDGGALLPFGGHKGSAIALMVELLAAGLTGGNFSFEIGSPGVPGTRTARAGELIILIDPLRVGSGKFRERVDILINRLHGSGVKRLPGARRYQARHRAFTDGIPVRETVLSELEAHLQGQPTPL
jgi:delta1-piperideine-2-carboxylate reductase